MRFRRGAQSITNQHFTHFRVRHKAHPESYKQQTITTLHSTLLQDLLALLAHPEAAAAGALPRNDRRSLNALFFNITVRR